MAELRQGQGWIVVWRETFGATFALKTLRALRFAPESPQFKKVRSLGKTGSGAYQTVARFFCNAATSPAGTRVAFSSLSAEITEPLKVRPP